jgi:hypothetical protein
MSAENPETRPRQRLRIARGMFRLWVVAAALWIAGVAATTDWGWYAFYQTPTDATAEICAKAKKAEECSALLTGAGRNPFDAFDLKWTDVGLGIS